VIGARLGEHLLLARIGRGGMGAVYLAQDDAGQRVALKVLEVRAEDRDAGLRRFGQELDVLRRVEHPRIVRALGPLRHEGEQRYFVMEYVRGRNLSQLLLEQGRLDPLPALAIVSDALEGLAAAHAAGVLHRDLKSANLLVDEEGRAKVCDFGLARAVDHTRLTLSGNVLGTPAYLSPEQARGHESRVESDLYSMGVVLYESLTGTLPFQAETPLALLRMHLDDAPDPPSSRRPGLPGDLDSLTLRALAKEPAQRFPSAEAMREAVEAVRAQLQGVDSTGLVQLTTAVQGQVDRETQALEAQASQTLAASRGRSLAPLAALALAGVTAGALLFWGGLPGTPADSVGEGFTPSLTVGSPTPSPREGVSPSPAEEDAPTLRATLTLDDDSTLSGQLVAIADGQVTLRGDDGQTQTVDRARVKSIAYGEER
jgi:serine/threonine-protein kinase